MKRLRIGVGGSAASPITIAHVALLEKLAGAGLFDLIIWIPSGERSDKPDLPDGVIRKEMTRSVFTPAWQKIQKTTIEVRYDDVEGMNMSTAEWFRKLEREYPDAVIRWYTGVDSVVPLRKHEGRSQIEAVWDEGIDLFQNRNFLIIPRKGYPSVQSITLPPHFQVLNVDIPECSSTFVRNLIKNGQPFEHLVPQGVVSLIKKYRLYGYQL